MRLFRLHIATRHGGDVTLYEVADNRAKRHFEADVLDAFVQAGANHERKDWLGFRACSEWWKVNVRKKGSDDLPKITRVVGVHELIDGDWVDLKPHFVEPHMLWHRHSDPTDETDKSYIATKEL